MKGGPLKSGIRRANGRSSEARQLWNATERLLAREMSVSDRKVENDVWGGKD
jgi:hypothetical protein